MQPSFLCAQFFENWVCTRISPFGQFSGFSEQSGNGVWLCLFYGQTFCDDGGRLFGQIGADPKEAENIFLRGQFVGYFQEVENTSHQQIRGAESAAPKVCEQLTPP